MPRTSSADLFKEWDELQITTAANAADLAHLAPFLNRLTTALEGARGANIRQNTLKAQMQQTTRDLEGFVAEGKEMATRLRNGIRTQYGLKGEKLAEFGMQPRRKAQKKAETPEEKPASAAAGKGTP